MYVFVYMCVCVFVRVFSFSLDQVNQIFNVSVSSTVKPLYGRHYQDLKIVDVKEMCTLHRGAFLMCTLSGQECCCCRLY